MALKPETHQHMQQAERHRAVAEALENPGRVTGLQPPPFDWAAVAAFYAAVHYVNAFLFERLGREPGDHRVRRGLVARVPELRYVLGSYDTLFDLGWHARYTAGFRVTQAAARQAVRQYLENVRNAVYQTLGGPLP
jgi:hypothetical protein